MKRLIKKPLLLTRRKELVKATALKIISNDEYVRINILIRRLILTYFMLEICHWTNFIVA
jgi:hypothetical protein